VGNRSNKGRKREKGIKDPTIQLNQDKGPARRRKNRKKGQFLNYLKEKRTSTRKRGKTIYSTRLGGGKKKPRFDGERDSGAQFQSLQRNESKDIVDHWKNDPKIQITHLAKASPGTLFKGHLFLYL